MGAVAHLTAVLTAAFTFEPFLSPHIAAVMLSRLLIWVITFSVATWSATSHQVVGHHDCLVTMWLFLLHQSITNCVMMDTEMRLLAPIALKQPIMNWKSVGKGKASNKYSLAKKTYSPTIAPLGFPICRILLCATAQRPKPLPTTPLPLTPLP